MEPETERVDALARAYWSVNEDAEDFWPTVVVALTDLGWSLVRTTDLPVEPELARRRGLDAS